jgi:hypothetical protein
MYVRILLFLFLLFSSFAYSNLTLKDRLIQAQAGDYIVSDQGGTYSLILIRYVDEDQLILEEIAVEQKAINLKKTTWKNWIENRAPGALSWVTLVIDLKKIH